MRSMKKRSIIICTVLVFAAVFIAVPALTAAEKKEVPAWDWKGKKPGWWTWGKDYWPSKPVRGGTYRVARPRYIGLMNPNHWPVYNFGDLEKIHGKLKWPDENLKPTSMWLAESYEFINPTTVIMKLRKGVEFTDGSSFNAETVKYQMDWI